MSTDSGSDRTAGQAVQPLRSREDHAEQAARLDRDNPEWIVVWGTFSRQFVAFPLFSVPAGTVLCNHSEPELVRRMRQTETIYGRNRNAG